MKGRPSSLPSLGKVDAELCSDISFTMKHLRCMEQKWFLHRDKQRQ